MSIRPLTVSRPAVSLLAVCVAVFVVARTTGSGWLVVILTGVGAIVAVAAGLPGIALLRLRLAVEAPRDATVGRTAFLSINLTGPSPIKVRSLVPSGDWTGAEPPVAGRLPVVPSRRGLVSEVVLEVRSGAPLGLVWWRRRYRFPLAQPIEVGPHPIDMPTPQPTAGGPAGHDARRTTGTADVVRSTRDYVAGDPIKLIHWAATARYGELMVKELESPVSAAVAVVVRLPSDDADEADQVAGRAAGVALAALREGLPVVLLTREAAGPRVGPVGSPLEVGRRLARAVGGPPATGPIARGTAVVEVS